MRNGKIQSFTDLQVWREGNTLVLRVYKITKNFPREELYSLVDQSNLTHQLLQGFIRKTRTFINRKS